MALGIENKEIDLLYLGEPSKHGGRRSIKETIRIGVYWSEDMSKIQNMPRFSQTTITAQAMIILEESLPKINTENVIIKCDDKYFGINNIDIIPTGFGLDGTYVLYLRDTDGKFSTGTE
jgi:hypothetical protein